MPGRHPLPTVIDGDAPGAARELDRAIASAESILVHRSGTVFAAGAVERLLRTLHRPHRRLVRVHSDAGPCYLARTELLALALHHGLTTQELLADAPGLDRRIAIAADAADAEGPTHIADPASGRWRVWVDGPVVGVRSGDGDPQWERSVARHNSAPAGLLRVARRRVGRVRREVVRRRQRPAGR